MTEEKQEPALRFRHVDDEKWQEVRAQQHGNHRVSIFEKWLEFTPNFLCLYAKWDPGMLVHEHGHNSDHILFVLEGEMMCGDVKCTKGMHVTLEHGAAFGPFMIVSRRGTGSSSDSLLRRVQSNYRVTI